MPYMPELPEVETVRRGLARLLPGLKITSIESNWPKSFSGAKNDIEQFVIGAKVMSVARRAKILLIQLSSNYSLVTHLKMTGQLVFVSKGHADKRQGNDKRFGAGHPNESLIGNLPDKSTRVTIRFSDGSNLFFNDQRKFGWMRLIPTDEVTNLDFFKKLGPEPLTTDFSWRIFQTRCLRRKNSNIKAVLLDQTIVAGIGNIYADELLWGAKIHPQTLVKNLSAKQFQALYKELLFVLRLAIKKGGSTDKNYLNAEGKKGSYLSFARVFRREGQTCPRCGTTIVKIRVANRGTHICPNCQQLELS